MERRCHGAPIARLSSRLSCQHTLLQISPVKVVLSVVCQFNDSHMCCSKARRFALKKSVRSKKWQESDQLLQIIIPIATDSDIDCQKRLRAMTISIQGGSP